MFWLCINIQLFAIALGEIDGIGVLACGSLCDEHAIFLGLAPVITARFHFALFFLKFPACDARRFCATSRHIPSTKVSPCRRAFSAISSFFRMLLFLHAAPVGFFMDFIVRIARIAFIAINGMLRNRAKGLCINRLGQKRYVGWVVDCRSSAFGLRPSVLGLRPSVFGLRSSVFGLRSSAFGLRSSVFGLRSSVLGLRS